MFAGDLPFLGTYSSGHSVHACTCNTITHAMSATRTTPNCPLDYCLSFFFFFFFGVHLRAALLAHVDCRSGIPH